MLLKPSVMSKPERKITEGGENQIQSSPEFCSKLGGPDALAPTLHRTSENIRGSIRPCGSRPDFCKFFTSCFCTTAWCCHDAMRVPTTRRRQDAPSSSGRRVPTTPPSIVGRGVLTMPPRVVRTSWRRHDAPPVPRRQLRFSDGCVGGRRTHIGLHSVADDLFEFTIPLFVVRDGSEVHA